MDFNEMQEALRLCRGAGITSLTWGHRGIGKSIGTRIFSQVMANDKSNPTGYAGFIDLRLSQMEASDIRGLPMAADGVTTYLPPAELPHGEFADGNMLDDKGRPITWGVGGSVNEGLITDEDGMPISKFDNDAILEAALASPDCPAHLQKKGADHSKVGLHVGVLFFDEPNRAEDDVLQAVFQIVYDRKVGLYSVPTGWSQHCAANFGKGEGYMVNNFNDEAFLDRFAHYTLEASEQYKTDWATFMGKYNTADKILQFVGFNEDHFLGKVDGEMGFTIKPSPRAWEMVAKVLDEISRSSKAGFDYSHAVIYQTLAGLIGLELAMQFDRFSIEISPVEIISNGTKKYEKKLKGFKRNAMVGLMWGISSHATKIKDKKKMKNVLEFVKLLAGHKERDLAVSLAQNLVRHETNKQLAGAVISNPHLAQILKTKKANKASWLKELQDDEDLADLMSKVAFGS